MRTIYLLPLGNADRNLVSGLCSPLQKTFQLPVEVREIRLDLAPFYDDPRGQFNSTQILQFLKSTELVREKGGRPVSSTLLAILPVDLFIPILTFVFGEAELNGSVAVVSYHRLQNEMYGLPKNRVLLEERLQKEALHELGHVHGLVHCTDLRCVMHTSTYVEDIDLKTDRFCKECTRNLAGGSGHVSVQLSAG